MGRRTRKFSSGGKNYLWAAVLVGQNIPNSPSFGGKLVQDTDWATHGGQQKATVLAIRGWLATKAVGTSSATAHMFIGVGDEDEAASQASPILAQTYIDEDIMWTGGASKAAGALSDGDIGYFEINIKAKRKIRSGQEVRLVTEASVVSQIALHGILRTLLLLNSG